jgi:hypothetical protein
MAGTLLNINEIVSDLADNNTKNISPLDVRQIVTSSYQPQMIFSGKTCESPNGSGAALVQSAYRCLYYNPYFFEPAGETSGGLSASTQIWEFTNNNSSSLTPNSTIENVEVIPDSNSPRGQSPASTPAIWTVYTGASGEVTKYDITSPGQGWVAPSFPGVADSYDGETGTLFFNGSTTGLEVKFNGPLKALTESADAFTYEISTNPNSSDLSGSGVHSPGQGSQAVADHTAVNTTVSGVANYGATQGQENHAVGIVSTNVIGVRTDEDRETYFQMYRNPGTLA